MNNPVNFESNQEMSRSNQPPPLPSPPSKRRLLSLSPPPTMIGQANSVASKGDPYLNLCLDKQVPEFKSVFASCLNPCFVRRDKWKRGRQRDIERPRRKVVLSPIELLLLFFLLSVVIALHCAVCAKCEVVDT
jgi:hypothetical protein